MFVQKKKQREKLEMLYRTYRKIMYYVALEIIQDSYLAEDIVSEAFFRVARHLDKINEEQSQKTKAFLCIVTKHIAIDFYRKQKIIRVLLWRKRNMYWKRRSVFMKDKERRLRFCPKYRQIMPKCFF